VGPLSYHDEYVNEDIKEEDHEDEDANGGMKVTVEEDFSTVPSQIKASHKAMNMLPIPT
jgi:hypothetical protein